MGAGVGFCWVAFWPEKQWGPSRGWFVGSRNLNNESIKTSMGVGYHVSLGENVEGINLNYRQLSAIVPVSVVLYFELSGRRNEMRSGCWER